MIRPLGFAEMNVAAQPPSDAPAPPPGREVSVVVFDLGNVLIRWDPRLAIAHAVGPERADAFLADTDFDFAAWNQQQDAGRSWADAVAHALTSHPHYEAEMRAYHEHFALTVHDPIEGSVAVLRELHAARVPLVALTNWSAESFPVARARHDFLDLFDDIVVSGQEGVAKPDPRIFAILDERIAAHGGLRRAVFVDDSPANVAAARRAGLDAIVFTSPRRLRGDLVARGLPLRPGTGLDADAPTTEGDVA